MVRGSEKSYEMGICTLSVTDTMFANSYRFRSSRCDLKIKEYLYLSEEVSFTHEGSRVER